MREDERKRERERKWVVATPDIGPNFSGRMCCNMILVKDEWEEEHETCRLAQK